MLPGVTRMDFGHACKLARGNGFEISRERRRSETLCATSRGRGAAGI